MCKQIKNHLRYAEGSRYTVTEGFSRMRVPNLEWGGMLEKK